MYLEKTGTWKVWFCMVGYFYYGTNTVFLCVYWPQWDSKDVTELFRRGCYWYTDITCGFILEVLYIGLVRFWCLYCDYTLSLPV